MRGFRIELEEIRTIINDFDGVQDSVTLVDPSNEVLVSFCISDGNTDVNDILHDVSKRLPSFMVPSRMVILDSFPLTPNGKVDKQQLLSTFDHHSDLNMVLPSNAIEEDLVHIWREILEVDNISVKDNFFALGGHSLLAMPLTTKINRHFDRSNSLSWIFNHKTIEEQAISIAQGRNSQYTPVIEYNKSSASIPLIIIHPGQAGAEVYRDFVHGFPEEQHIVLIDSYNLNSHEEPIDSIEALVSKYLSDIQHLNINKCYLAGWSFGGLVALEMSQQLLLNGVEVAHLFLLDSYLFQDVDITAPVLLNNLLALNLYRLDTFDISEEFTEKFKQVMLLEFDMMARYQPKIYRGNTTLFKATKPTALLPEMCVPETHGESVSVLSEYYETLMRKHDNGWARVASDVHVHSIDASHYELLEEAPATDIITQMCNTMSIIRK